MGRDYYGDIAGRFWGGVQDSSDAEHFGEQPSFPIHYCYTCDCEEPEYYNHEDMIIKCETCGCLYECEKQDDEDTLVFYFNKDNVNEIQIVLNNIKSILPDIPIPVFTEINSDGEEDGIDFDFGYEFEYQKDEHKDLQARWCLGHQILECIEATGECEFSCEV